MDANMSSGDVFARWLRPLFFLGRNWISLVGMVITTSTAITMMAFWAFQVITNARIPPYFGLIFYLILPSLFVLGLILIPIGALWRRHLLIGAQALPETYPKIDFHDPSLRTTAYWIAGLTIANMVIIGSASYRSVEYMDSVTFCGQTCHTVMEPEFTAYANSPHSRVACVSCHIGPGASWFVKSKLSGLRQVYAVAFHTYETPIPTPVENLRPAQETCEQCHWPQMFQGDKLIVRNSYADDEKNTQSTSVLLLKIGGKAWMRAVGIHGRHLDPANRVRYWTNDRSRQSIGRIEYTEDNGSITQFNAGDSKLTPEDLAKPGRIMDCVDCHNRPTHTFLPVAEAVDQALSQDQISPSIPYIKKKAVEVLQTAYPDRETARQQIRATLTAFYQAQYADFYQKQKSAIDRSIEQVENLYLRNIFPAMKVTWGTYPNNIGHMNTPGCFRCHDGSHTSKDGRSINQDCDSCHVLLAMQEQNPAVLDQLQIHPSPNR
jgi:hypothetical protein